MLHHQLQTYSLLNTSTKVMPQHCNWSWMKLFHIKGYFRHSWETIAWIECRYQLVELLVILPFHIHLTSNLSSICNSAIVWELFLRPIHTVSYSLSYIHLDWVQDFKSLQVDFDEIYDSLQLHHTFHIEVIHQHWLILIVVANKVIQEGNYSVNEPIGKYLQVTWTSTIRWIPFGRKRTGNQAPHSTNSPTCFLQRNLINGLDCWILVKSEEF